jgi:hypothetical protein
MYSRTQKAAAMTELEPSTLRSALFFYIGIVAVARKHNF